MKILCSASCSGFSQGFLELGSPKGVGKVFPKELLQGGPPEGCWKVFPPRVFEKWFSQGVLKSCYPKGF